MTEKEWLSLALAQIHTGQWYGWKKFDAQGNKIPNDQRMCYECIEIIKDGAVMPTKAEVEAKIQELKDAETANTNARTTGKAKLKSGDALTDAEIKALFGDN